MVKQTAHAYKERRGQVMNKENTPYLCVCKGRERETNRCLVFLVIFVLFNLCERDGCELVLGWNLHFLQLTVCWLWNLKLPTLALMQHERIHTHLWGLIPNPSFSKREIRRWKLKRNPKSTAYSDTDNACFSNWRIHRELNC